MKSKWWDLFVCLTMICSLPACWSDATSPSESPHSFLLGEYSLLVHNAFPLPYSDYRTQEYVSAGTLQIYHSGYEKLIQGRDVTRKTGGYSVRGDTVELVSSGEAEIFRYRDGVLESNNTVFVRSEGDIPHDYKYERYELTSCDGHPPSFNTPCSRTGEYFLYRSSIWLWQSGRYDISDAGVGATWRRSSTYVLDNDSIVLVGMRTPRVSGSLLSDTLAFGTFVYVRVPGQGL